MPFIRPLADPARVATMLGGVLPAEAVALLPFLPLALAVALLPLGTAFTFPCVTALLSRVISSTERGLYMGVQQTFGGLARVLFPILFGFLFDRNLELPFLLSAALVLFTDVPRHGDGGVREEGSGGGGSVADLLHATDASTGDPRTGSRILDLLNGNGRIELLPLGGSYRNVFYTRRRGDTPEPQRTATATDLGVRGRDLSATLPKNHGWLSLTPEREK